MGSDSPSTGGAVGFWTKSSPVSGISSWRVGGKARGERGSWEHQKETEKERDKEAEGRETKTKKSGARGNKRGES